MADDTLIEHGLRAVRQPLGRDYHVYRDGKECGRFTDRGDPWPSVCRVTMYSRPGKGECGFQLGGLVLVREEERICVG